MGGRRPKIVADGGSQVTVDCYGEVVEVEVSGGCSWEGLMKEE